MRRWEQQVIGFFVVVAKALLTQASVDLSHYLDFTFCWENCHIKSNSIGNIWDPKLSSHLIPLFSESIWSHFTSLQWKTKATWTKMWLN